MRPIPGTITDPRAGRVSVLKPMTFDEYQTLAEMTAVYPRVYTEDQVANLVKRFVVREATNNVLTLDEIDALVPSYLDEFETPFNRLVYPVLGLIGEAGEIANKLKKVARDDQGQMDLDKSEDIAKEVGDVAWYQAAIATELRVKLGQIARDNITKLFDRKDRGVLGGSGDNR